MTINGLFSVSQPFVSFVPPGNSLLYLISIHVSRPNPTYHPWTKFSYQKPMTSHVTQTTQTLRRTPFPKFPMHLVMLGQGTYGLATCGSSTRTRRLMIDLYGANDCNILGVSVWLTIDNRRFVMIGNQDWLWFANRRFSFVLGVARTFLISFVVFCKWSILYVPVCLLFDLSGIKKGYLRHVFLSCCTVFSFFFTQRFRTSLSINRKPNLVPRTTYLDLWIGFE